MTRSEHKAERPWSVPVARHEVPETGRRFELTADAHTRAAIAELAGLRSLPRLEATFDVAPRGRDSLRVTGRVAATVGQVCVVTLDPIENEVEDRIDLVFAPPAAPTLIAEAGATAPVEVPAVDAPEVLVGGVVDLGAVATEFLILGIDPYPRKAGAVFDPPPGGDEAGHPFAVLAALKQRHRGDEG
jgi:uncharacterized metal-binding protein YceD (DUF177 family)